MGTLKGHWLFDFIQLSYVNIRSWIYWYNLILNTSMDEDSCCFFLIGGIDCWISHYNFIQYRKEKENLQSQKIYLRVYQFEAGDVEVHYHIQLVENYKNKDYHIATQVVQFEG